jgi:hypothetical protein
MERRIKIRQNSNDYEIAVIRTEMIRATTHELPISIRPADQAHFPLTTEYMTAAYNTKPTVLEFLDLFHWASGVS